MKYKDCVGETIHGIFFFRPATTMEILMLTRKKFKIVHFMVQKPKHRHVKNRNKCWYGKCIECDKEYVVRSDYIDKQRCKCKAKELK